MWAEDSLVLRQNQLQVLQASQAYLWQVTGWVRSLDKGISVPGTVRGTGDHDSGSQGFHSLVDETETSTISIGHDTQGQRGWDMNAQRKGI